MGVQVSRINTKVYAGDDSGGGGTTASMMRAHKTVQVKNGVLLFWREQKTDEKSLEFILDKNSLVPIVEIAFPRSVYLFHCSIQNKAGGDETTFAFAVAHHQNSTQR